MKNRLLKQAVVVLAGISALAGAAFAQGEAPAGGGGNARDLRVTEVVIARDVVDHEPSEPGTSFGGDDDLYCFIRVENRTRADAAIFVAWESASAPVGPARGGTRLEVPARPRYRTYARTVVHRDAGRYRCVVRAEGGAVLGQAEFDVQ